MENGKDLLYEDLDVLLIPPESEASIKLPEDRIQELENAFKRIEEDKKAILNELNSFKKDNKTLRVNFSSFYQTAKREIERNHNTIKELQQQLDDCHFRCRCRKSWPQRNYVIPPQNKDNTLDVKPIPVNEIIDVPVVLPGFKNYDLSARGVSSNSDDKSLNLTRSRTKHLEFSEKEKLSYSTHIKNGDSLTLDRRSKASSDYKYTNPNSISVSNRDEHYFSRNSSDSYHYRRSERKPRQEDCPRSETDDRERRARVDSTKQKDRQRYSLYEYRKEEHDRCRHKVRRPDDDYEKHHKVKRLSDDRNLSRHEFDDGYRGSKDDFRRQNIEFSGRRMYEERKKDELVTFGRQSLDDRRKDVEFVDRKANEDGRREEPALAARHDMINAHQQTPESLVVARKSAEKGEKDEQFDRHSQDASSISDSQPNTKFFVRKSLENHRRKEDQVSVGRHSAHDERGVDPKLLAEKPMTIYTSRMLALEARQRQAEQQRDQKSVEEDPYKRDSVPRDSHESYPSSKLSPDTESPELKKKPKPLRTSLSVDVRGKPSRNIGRQSRTKKKNSTNTVSSPPNTIDSSVAKAEQSCRKAEERSSSDGNDEIRSKRVKLSPHISSPAKAAWCSPAHDSSHPVATCSPPKTAPLSGRGSPHSASSGASEEPATKPPPVDKQIMLMEILAQYGGIYATPLKLLNGDKYAYPNFKLVSPIADTPDHLRAALSDPNIKVSPIPMINERRALDGFNSPVKKGAAAKKTAAPLADKGMNGGGEETPENSADASCAAIAESSANETPSAAPEVSGAMAAASPCGESGRLNGVTTSSLKNCCIVKVQAERTITGSEADGAESSTVVQAAAGVCGTDTMSAEHKVFARKRRAPVIRNVKNVES